MMAQFTPAPIVNVGYRSTNYWVVSAGTSRLLVDITTEGNVTMSCAESRPLLGQIGLSGEILPAPGHSDHCVSLLLDDGSVFTGDLPPEINVGDNPVALATWRLLRERGATRVYPAHGSIWCMDDRPSNQPIE